MMADEAAGAPSYLEMLDSLLRMGAEGLGEQFTSRQVGYVLGHQQPDGGFAGRDGPSDLYYTEFALRTLDLLSTDRAAHERVASHLASADPPSDVVHCYSLLACARSLQRCGFAVQIDEQRVRETLAGQALAGGGYGRAGSGEPSVSQTFVAALCHQLLDGALPESTAAVQLVRELRRGDGGFAEMPGQSAGQTNASAAAIGLLTIVGDLTEEETTGVAKFIAGMQDSGGGLRTHANAPAGDLLSTFTGVVTLGTVGGIEALDLRGVAQFVREMAIADGGFRAAAADGAGDVEYTWYGVGCVALLRALVMA